MLMLVITVKRKINEIHKDYQNNLQNKLTVHVK